jgi:transposase
MGHVEGQSRYQRALCAASLDEMISADHPVRVIDAFVEVLDLRSLGFSKMDAEETGRPPYHPGDLAKLYLYGYANQVRSSRRLEKEATRNLEVRWLINELTPSFKTIADFRKDHPEALVGLYRAFIQFCRSQSLVGGLVVAVDGSKIEAVASRKKVITPQSLEKQLAAVDRKIADYLAGLDEADRAEDAEADEPTDVAAALAALQEQRKDLQATAEADDAAPDMPDVPDGGQGEPAELVALRQRRELLEAQARSLADQQLSQQVIGECEAQLMRTARHGHQVAYNAQIATDADHGLIVAFDLTSECNDYRLLLPMAEQAKEAVQAETLTVVADVGYSNGQQGHLCQQAGITAMVPRPQTVNTRGKHYFSRDAFSYDGDSDTYTCPAGETMTVNRISHTEHNKTYGTKACAGCALRPQCTKATGRVVVRDFYEDDRQAMHDRTVADPRWMKLRRELAEHPYGTIKWMMGYPRFLVRGRRKAKAELALMILGFNLKRAITIRGVKELLAALAEQPAPA